jgi:DNA-binding LacI/PurR family transcriptional regulator
MPSSRDAVRLVDVAKRAGVTVSTASRALARPEMVRPETRERVELAAAELGYAPNRAARSLITGRSGVIAIVVPDLANTYFAHIARAAQQFARARSYEVLIVDIDDDVVREQEFIESASTWVEGLIVCAARRPYRRTASRVPMVFVNRRVRDSHSVLLDQHFIVEAQLRHLIELGHEQIVWMDGPKGYWASSIRRNRARRIGVGHPIRITDPLAPDWEGGVEMAELLDNDVTAVAAFNDRQALGFMMRCAQLGIRVPDDVSVVGSDDIAGAAVLSPGLTTVHAPKEQMGRAAVSLLLDHLTEGEPVICETLRGHLVVRGSTAPPRPTL